ncbi:YicC/YloC family endoribonuclease [Roseicyclus sediminis]|uniref:YicC/YloC family endoribonuclease n=1 Tax=Roseicyclus sediminis TaxID=2980997 RepID=UPI00292A5425|nr:YicC/YloC family endoribonuclease [Roseibacterium sp. SDUM158016]
MVNGTAEQGRIASMTGFATLEGAAPGLRWSWEIRGVNGRGLDLRLRLPDGLGALEAPLRKLLSDKIARGSVTLGLRLTRSEEAGAGGVDAAALETALNALAQVRAAAEARGMELSRPSAAEILALRGMAETAGAPEPPEAARLLSEAGRLIEAFLAMRLSEGRAVAEVLGAQIDRIAALTEAAETAAAARAVSQAETFRANVRKLLDTADLDEARLAQELALLAVKSDVTEEIDRLRAHVAAARELLATGGPVGRKLDFLMQEFNREANTLCSKSGDAALTAIGLDLKLAIDQTREQVQNVE